MNDFPKSALLVLNLKLTLIMNNLFHVFSRNKIFSIKPFPIISFYTGLMRSDSTIFENNFPTFIYINGFLKIPRSFLVVNNSYQGLGVNLNHRSSNFSSANSVHNFIVNSEHKSSCEFDTSSLSGGTFQKSKIEMNMNIPYDIQQSQNHDQTSDIKSYSLDRLERDKFCKTLIVTRCTTAKNNLHIISRLLRPYLIRIHNHKLLPQPLEKDLHYLYLDANLLRTYSDLPKEICEKLQKYRISCGNFVESYQLQLSYENLTTSEIFKELLPGDFENISSFTCVGHLIHVNIRDDLKPYRHLIGQVLLDKNPKSLAVVDKSNIIDNTYRNFALEIIARHESVENKPDKDLMIVELKENNCRFKLDFSRVYWNSRLGTEHERIVESFRRQIDIVFDLCAGIGPFSIPAAKRQCHVYANDLNPDSYKWLKFNSELNKIKQENLTIYNEDAREFIEKRLPQLLAKHYREFENEEPATKPKFHILMNLPAMAVEFLTNFVGLISRNPPVGISNELIRKWLENCEHIVHCYCFLKGEFEKPEIEVKKMVEKSMKNIQLTDKELLKIYNVRHVAPNKDMYRVDIRLSDRILFAINMNVKKEDDRSDSLSNIRNKKLKT